MEITFNFSLESPSEDEDNSVVIPESGFSGFCALLQHLDKQDIITQQRLSSSKQHRCKSCGQENFGYVLDEALILLPFAKGAFRGRTALLDNVYIDPTTGTVTSERTGARTGDFRRYASYNQYMIIQDIVRSGLFSEEQLRGPRGKFSPLFSRHCLEVNAKAFYLVRPETCITCRNVPLMGLSPHWRVIYGSCEAATDVIRKPSVDDLHAAGKTIRTGFRIRSKDARKRRKCKKAHVPTRITYSIDELIQLRVGKSVYVPPVPSKSRNTKRNLFYRLIIKKRLKQSLNYIKPPRRCWCDMTHHHRPAAHHTKYWYYFRKFRMWKVSTHHPYGDECSVYCKMFRRTFNEFVHLLT